MFFMRQNDAREHGDDEDSEHDVLDRPPLCLFDDEEEEEAEEESLPFRISTKQIEYALGKKWRKNSTQKDSHKI